MQNSVPNDDKNDTSTPYSSEDAAANSTSDVGSPNEADVDSALDADSPSEVGTSSTSNSTPNSVSNSAPDSTPESALTNTSDASPTPQHPHRKRNIAIGVIIAVIVVAAIVIILAFAHPWDVGDNNDTASDESNSSSNESSLRIDEPEGISGEDNANGYDEPGDTDDPNNNTGGNSSQSESSRDTTTESGDIPTIPSEWITGPQTFDSEEDAERFEAGEWHTDKSLRSRYGFKEVKTDDGTTYVAGELIVVVPQSTTDESVTFIAQKLGGVIAEIYDSELFDERLVTIVFPDNADIEKLSEDAARLDGVRSAHVDSVGSIEEINNVDGNNQADIVDLSFTNDPLASSQGYLSQSRFTDAWDVVRCNGSVTVAVLDTGVSLSHTDLAGVVDGEHAWDAIEDMPLDTSSPDKNGHGTAVSGVIAAEAGNGQGIAGTSYNATILPVRVLGSSGKGDYNPSPYLANLATDLGR